MGRMSELDIELRHCRHLMGVVVEFCEARSAYDRENFPGGFPKYYTAQRLYLAGMALYAAADVEAVVGRYVPGNSWFVNEDGSPKKRHDER